MKPKELAEKLGIVWSENMDHEEILAEHYRRQGRVKVHLCPDWDFMAIHLRQRRPIMRNRHHPF